MRECGNSCNLASVPNLLGGEMAGKPGKADHVYRRPKLTKRFRLNGKICRAASQSSDPLVRAVQKTLKAFEFSQGVGVQYTWKYLTDEAFQRLCTQFSTETADPFKINHLVMSHLVRVIEAYEMVSIWRSWELISSCIINLNNDQIISAATLSRSLIELTVSYGEAVNMLRHNFERFAWDKLHTHVLGMDQIDSTGKHVGLEIFIERLMFGTRLPDRLTVVPGMEQKNILTIIDKMDKKLVKQGHGYTIRPHYDFLSEIVYPNTLGYARFSATAKTLDSGWIEQLMEEKANSQFSTTIATECLWSLSFSTGSLDGLFGEFQILMKDLKQHLGSILP